MSHSVLGWLLIFSCLAFFATPASAQNNSRVQSYWQFAASGRLDTILNFDVDGDGVDEFLVLDENGHLTLLTADGRSEWTYISQEPISALGTIKTNGGEESLTRQIALAGIGYLTLLDQHGEVAWRVSLNSSSAPVAIDAFDYQSDGAEDILLLLNSGQLIAFNANGDVIWQFASQENSTAIVNPQMVVDDFDGDGANEIVMGVFTARRFSELYYLDDGIVKWQQAISRRITHIAKAPFGPSGNAIAVGTNFGQLELYSSTGDPLWYRTVNKPITSLVTIQLPEGPALALGTASGSVIAYSAEGRRLWTNHLVKDADRRVLTLLPAGGRTATGQTPLAAILEPATTGSELADLLLLGNNGQTLAKLNDTDLPDLTRLVDVNHDGHYELLLARFATLQLIGLGMGDSEYIQEWDYVLDAEPTAMLIQDLDEDGEDEIIVGTRDGRLHSLGMDRAIRWLNAPGGVISLLDRVRYASGDPPHIVVVRRQRPPADFVTDDESVLSWLELREATGDRLWEITVPANITSLLIDDKLGAGESSIIIGTQSGDVSSFNLDGNQRWTFSISDSVGAVQQLIQFRPIPGEPQVILAVGQYSIVRLIEDGGNISVKHFATFDEPVQAVYGVQQLDRGESTVKLIVFTRDGLVHGLNHEGAEMTHLGWPYKLPAPPRAIMPSDQWGDEALQQGTAAFLLATGNGQLSHFVVDDNKPNISWSLNELGQIQSINWDDLDKDGQPDTGIFGSQDDHLWLYEQLQGRNPRLVLQQPLGSSTFALALLKRTSRQSPDLLAVTQNGLIRLFSEEENRPPLLTQPVIESDQRQFTIGIQAADVENDFVTVQLELLDEAINTWRPVSEQQLPTGNGQLFWPGITAPEGSTKLNYRFRFSDGFYRGYVSPPAGPRIEPPEVSDSTLPVLAGSIGLLIMVGFIAHVRQSQTPAAQADRFYDRLAQEPRSTLALVEQKYAMVNGSPDFLLQLANRARHAEDTSLANLSDGLFLLANRPQAGLPIITRTLDDAADTDKKWDNLAQRRMIYRTCQAMLEAPSITELGLVRPQFVHLLTELEEKKEWSPVLETLLPVLTNMRDSDRVEAIDDRLVYLNQAAVRLRQVQDQVNESTPSVERTLVRSIARRWSGLLTAEIEEQRGRAELEVLLKTKRLAPNGQTHVAMEIRNTGRAPAENIVAILNENPAYAVRSEPQAIPFLPAGHAQQVRFLIEPQAEERFRVGLSLIYDDRNQRRKTTAFGDMVHLLPPVRDFVPIPNPYLPGTPLRKDSPLFFGREELFDFIAEHAGTQAQRNVFMLVGQRRTGKTSLLLRLGEYLPSHLMPVYIDCQSLGVSPGMPALLQEFAWHIADVLSIHGLDLEVPEIDVWQADPTRVFQRELLPAARRLLPANTTLLMIFDEFEAFESMVADGILPRTFFPYMRHLMQHSTGLGFVFVGTRRLEEMSADYWSVLFNIALYRKIDFLSPQAAERLICEPVAPNLVYDDLALDKILRVTAGHPYFLQLVCYTLVKQANERKTGYVTISDVNTALDDMLRLGEAHFAYLWQRSNPVERAVLAAVAHLMDRNEPLHPEEIVDYLQTYSIELNPAETTHALNALVEQDVMQEVTVEGKSLYELRIGLVGLWVVQNKSLSKLHVHLES